MRKVSLKLQKLNRAYIKIAKVFLEENSVCQAGLEGCTYHSTDVHHKKGRGIWLLIVEFFLATCRSCHIRIENSPLEAKEKGLSLDRL